MIKKEKLIICSLSLALVAGTTFACASDNGGLHDKTLATVTFNADNGTWLDNKTSIRTLTIVKGHTWGYLVNHHIGEEEVGEGYIYNGTGINLVADDTEKHHDFNGWNIGNAQITDDYVINSDITVTADIAPLQISVTLWAQSDHQDTSHYFDDGGEGSASRVLSTYVEGTVWSDAIQEANIPLNQTGNTETFLYYTNEATGQKIENGYVLKDGDQLVANYLKDKPNDFETDSWEIVSQAANLGFEYMSTKEHDDFGYKQDYVENGNTFVGLERTVLIGGTNYKVRVIGENVDNISPGKSASLTFEFEDIICANRCFDVASHNSNSYEGSALYDYLNTKFYYTLPPEVRNAIVPVRKYTNVGSSAPASSIRTTQEVLFPLSLRELNYKKVNDVETPLEGVQFGNREAYALYNKGTDDEQAALRVRHTLKPDGTQGPATTYWLRSPDLDTSAFAWAIDDTGHVPNIPLDVNDAHGVACGFCIGGAPSKYNVTFNVSVNGGEWNEGGDSDAIYEGDETKTFVNAKGWLKSAGGHPNDPKYHDDSQHFTGWFSSQGTEISDYYPLTNGSFTAYANFDSNDTYNITLGGGDNRFSLSKSSFVSGKAFDVQLRPATYIDAQDEQYAIHTYPELDSLSISNANGRNYISNTDYTYDRQTGTISFKSSATTSGNITVTIKHAPIVCDWQHIGLIATEDERMQSEQSTTAGDYAKQFFYVGDTTTLTVQGVEHKIQIIDFGHTGDTFTSGTKTLTAAINFDFLTIASKLNGTQKVAITSNFSDEEVEYDDMHYKGNNLWHAVSDFYQSTPSSFRNLVKNVNKKTLQGDEDNYRTVYSESFTDYFYPLSMAETNCLFSSTYSTFDKRVFTDEINEGAPYALYANCGITQNVSETIEKQKPLIKYNANGSSFVSYYLRTGANWFDYYGYYGYYAYYNSCIMTKHNSGYMRWNTTQVEEDYIENSQHIYNNNFAPGFAI